MGSSLGELEKRPAATKCSDRNEGWLKIKCTQRRNSDEALSKDLETTPERGPNDHQHKKIARSAEDVSQCYRGSVQTPPPEATALIRELHELARDILTSQDFLNSKVKL
jgi:hypothetical protein